MTQKISTKVSFFNTMALRNKMSYFETICFQYFWEKKNGSPRNEVFSETPRRII